jgi:hypothetical protein
MVLSDPPIPAFLRGSREHSLYHVSDLTYKEREIPRSLAAPGAVNGDDGILTVELGCERQATRDPGVESGGSGEYSLLPRGL